MTKAIFDKPEPPGVRAESEGRYFPWISLKNCSSESHHASFLLFTHTCDWSSVAGEGQSCEEGEAVGDEPRLQDPLHGAQVRPGPNGFSETLQEDHRVKVQHVCNLGVFPQRLCAGSCVCVCVCVCSAAWRPVSPWGRTPTLSPVNATWRGSRRILRPSGDPKLEPDLGN